MTKIDVRPTVADGLAVSRIGDLAFEIARSRIDDVVTVSEEELSLAMLRLVELEKSVVEGAGAAPLAALMAGKLPQTRDRRTVVVLSGGNVDPMILTRVIEKALVADGRLCRFTAVVADRPGGLARLTQLIAQSGASIQEITHDRAFAGPDIGAVNVLCTVETSDRHHLQELYELLAREGIQATPLRFPAANAPSSRP